MTSAPISAARTSDRFIAVQYFSLVADREHMGYVLRTTRIREGSIMRLRLSLIMALLLLCEPAGSASARRHWRIYQHDPDIKISVCYPTDLLRTRPDTEYKGWIDLNGAGGATVLLNGRPDKYTTLKDEMRHSIAEFSGGPRWIHDPGPGLTPLRFYNSPRMKITSSMVTQDSYLYVMEDKKEVIIDWAIHVDHAIKDLFISYPKSRAAAWKGVPERMRSCFKSLGPITNPLIQ